MSKTHSLYIHIPYCISKCKYCDFFSVPCGKKSVPDEYITSLCNEIIYRLQCDKTDFLNTIYIGGGTPSLLQEFQLTQIFSSIKTVTSISKDAEISIEVNPDDVSYEMLKIFNNVGINRISCGIQSLQNKSLEISCRRADAEINRRALNILSSWTHELSLDLICGLPGETEESFLQGIKKVVKFNPQHISMYSLTIEDETPFGEMFNKGQLNIDFEKSDLLWLKGKELLEKYGYEQYEVSNFARKGFECNHNLVYWNHQNYLGCGSGGTGTVYNQDGSGIRITNLPDLDKYIKFWNSKNPDFFKIPVVKEIVSIEDSIFEFFMMGLRKLEGVFESEFIEIFNQNIPDKILNCFIKWNNKNLCEIIVNEKGRRFTLGNKGILYLNKFLEEIL